MFFYTFDIYYLILAVPAILFSLLAQWKVNSTFKKYSKIRARRGTTGAQAAGAILRQNGLYDIGVERVGGRLTDHYDPRKKLIRLSDAVGGETSVAAVGIAAHEAGHALQHATSYGPIRLRQAIIPVTRLGSFLAFPLIIAGLFFMNEALNDFGPLLINLGILFFGAAFVFQLVTLPVEFNASRRALQALEGSNMLDQNELVGAQKVLSAAALTYVAALAVSLAQLLRLLLVFGRRR